MVFALVLLKSSTGLLQTFEPASFYQATYLLWNEMSRC